MPLVITNLMIDIEAQAKSSEDVYAGAKSRVLVCDDSKMVRMTACKFLAPHFDLVMAEDGEQAWDIVCQTPDIQVVFTDLGMPRLDGYGLITRIRNAREECVRNLPIIVITGASEEDGARQRVFDIGATDFITKPFKGTTLVARAEAHSAYRQLNNTLRDGANFDPLTNTLNRRGFSEQLAKDLAFTRRHGAAVAVAIFSLDDFAHLFEQVGQKTCDNISREVAKLLQGALRREDSICHDGRGRFLVSLPMAKSEGVVKLARRVAERVHSFHLTVGKQDIPLFLSTGITVLGPRVDGEVGDIIATAEEALVNARTVGDGEVQLIKFDKDDALHTTTLPSIDAALEALDKCSDAPLPDQMDALIARLRPLVKHMSAAQRKRLIA